MLTEVLHLTIPVALAQELETAEQDWLIEVLERGVKTLRIERALRFYAKGDVSLSAAAQQAGLSLSEMARHAYAFGLEPPYSERTVAEELA